MTPIRWVAVLLLTAASSAGAQRVPGPGKPIVVLLENQHYGPWRGPVFLLYDDGTVVTGTDSPGKYLGARLTSEQLAVLKERLASVSGSCSWKSFYRMYPEPFDYGARFGPWSLYLPGCRGTKAVVVLGWVFRPNGSEPRYRVKPDLDPGLPADLKQVLRLLATSRAPQARPWTPLYEYGMSDWSDVAATFHALAWPGTLPPPGRWKLDGWRFVVPVTDAQRPLIDSIYERQDTTDENVVAGGKRWHMSRSPTYPGEASWARAFADVEEERHSPERRFLCLSSVAGLIGLMLGACALALEAMRRRPAKSAALAGRTFPYLEGEMFVPAGWVVIALLTTAGVLLVLWIIALVVTPAVVAS